MKHVAEFPDQPKVWLIALAAHMCQEKLAEVRITKETMDRLVDLLPYLHFTVDPQTKDLIVSIHN